MDTVTVFCAIDELKSWPMPHSNWLHEFVPFIVWSCT
jgi:hypothetical protein